jgi:TonB family protein
VPVEKVDPKYPPELIKDHVEGEVVLYAIIHRDGSVDSIQVVHSVDPQLDKDAKEAFAQWKFRPGAREGEPVDLEAVVYIPFRYRAPQ